MGVIFALLSAVGFGSSMFFTQMGLKSRRVTVLQGMMVNLVAGNVALWLAFGVSLFFHSVTFTWSGIGYFVASGLLASLLGRSTNFMAIQRLGAARASSLVLSETVFAGPLAFVLFGQRLSPATIAGIGLLILGMALCISEMRGHETGSVVGTPDLASVVHDHPVIGGGAGGRARRRKLSRTETGVVLGLSTGLFAAGANLSRQAGVHAIPSALLGAAIGMLAALLVVGPTVLRAGQVRDCLHVASADALHFAASGLAASVATLSVFWAFDAGGSVAVVTALKSTSPLVTFALAALLLSRHDRITRSLGLRITVVVIGAVVTTVSWVR